MQSYVGAYIGRIVCSVGRCSGRAYIMQRGFSTRKFPRLMPRKFLDIIQPWLYVVQGAAINEDMRARKFLDIIQPWLYAVQGADCLHDMRAIF